jgi:hypothetical protein
MGIVIPLQIPCLPGLRATLSAHPAIGPVTDVLPQARPVLNTPRGGPNGYAQGRIYSF